jgi:hypothetical protein
MTQAGAFEKAAPDTASAATKAGDQSDRFSAVTR